ncbi:MAG: metallophosphoesterase [Eubacteriales bacterium]
MSLFAIADTHLSFGVDKPMEIFPGWADFEKRLEKNWRAVVKETDIVVIAGDVSWAMVLPQAVQDFKFLHDLPGRKLLIKGNHDYWWTSKRKMDAFLAENSFDSIEILHNNSYQAGPISVCGTRGWSLDSDSDEDRKVLLREVGRLKASIAAAKQFDAEPVVFLHYPPVTGENICEEIFEVLVKEDVKRCFYGHLHAQAMKNSINAEREGIKFNLISSDFLGFCPKLVEKY